MTSSNYSKYKQSSYMASSILSIKNNLQTAVWFQVFLSNN